jgi:hypothetical protein
MFKWAFIEWHAYVAITKMFTMLLTEIIYVCLEDYKQNFLKYKSFIKLDECFWKGYYDGTILATVGSGIKDQILSVTITVVEG